MRKLGKRILTMTLAAVIGVTCYAPIEARAERIDHYEWSESSAVWEVSEGVTAYVKDGVLYFEGNGAIPDYTGANIYERPWHGVLIEAVNVGPGITEIGTKAFAEFKKLKYITVYSTTFIKSGNAFDKIDSAPQVRIMGTEEMTRMIGDKIPYTSLDSWARVAQSRIANIVYIVDNGEIAAVIVNDDEVTLKRVYYYPERQQLILQPENPMHQPQIYSEDELDHIRIIGKAIAVTHHF